MFSIEFGPWLRLAVRLPHPLGRGRAVVGVFLPGNRRGILGELGNSGGGGFLAFFRRRHLLGRGCRGRGLPKLRLDGGHLLGRLLAEAADPQLLRGRQEGRQLVL